MRSDFMSKDAAHPEIVTLTSENNDVLKNVCKPANIEDLDQIKKLYEVYSEVQGLGLAAPQVGLNKRIFIADLQEHGQVIFFNPTLTIYGEAKSPSTEGCFSIPGVARTIDRFNHVSIDADKICNPVYDSESEELTLMDITQLAKSGGPFKIECTGLDAAIVQHEYDHLNGILMTDHPEVKTLQQKVQEKSIARQRKIAANRAKRKAQKKNPAQKINKKRQAKLDKEWKRSMKQQRLRAEIQEYYRSSLEGL